jgi:glycosyltransferase involved in cell wall biosynthesis
MLCIASLGGGGAERVLSELANHYADRGIKVTLITLDPPGRNSIYTLDPRISQVNLCGTFSRSVVRKIIAQIKSLFRLRQRIKSEQPDTVLSFMTPTNNLTILACIGLGVHCVVSERSHPGRFSYSMLTDRLRSLLYRFASAVVVQTPDIACWFQSRIRGKFLVIPNFINRNRPESSSLRQQSIIAVGRLGSEKRFDDLINAFALAINRFPNWRLNILGEGLQRPLLQSLIEQHGLGDKIILSGFVSNPDYYMSTAAIAAQPSRFEGFPNALLEAMASGLAVVASHEAGDMLIEDGVNGLLVPAGDVYQLAHALERLMGDAQLRATLGQNALAVRDTYSQERVMPLWNSLLFPGHVFNDQEMNGHD